MDQDKSHLDEIKLAYKEAIDVWVSSIRDEERLALEVQSIADLDEWAASHFREEELRAAAKQARQEYECAIRKEFFGF